MQHTENERMGKRQELAGPIMDALKLWMETEGIKYSPNSLTGKAITYAYTRWGEHDEVSAGRTYPY